MIGALFGEVLGERLYNKGSKSAQKAQAQGAQKALGALDEGWLNASNQLRQFTGIQGSVIDSLQRQFEFNPEGIFSDPAYRQQLEEGMGQLENTLGALGINQSSTGGRQVARYLNDLLAGQTQQSYQRQMGAFDANSANARALLGASSNASSQLASHAMQTGQSKAGVHDSLGDAIAQQKLNRGEAKAGAVQSFGHAYDYNSRFKQYMSGGV